MKRFEEQDQNETRDALLIQIEAAKHTVSLGLLEVRVARHYKAGTITADQLAELDGRIMERLSEFS